MPSPHSWRIQEIVDKFKKWTGLFYIINVCLQNVRPHPDQCLYSY